MLKNRTSTKIYYYKTMFSKVLITNKSKVENVILSNINVLFKLLKNVKNFFYFVSPSFKISGNRNGNVTERDERAQGLGDGRVRAGRRGGGRGGELRARGRRARVERRPARRDVTRRALRRRARARRAPRPAPPDALHRLQVSTGTRHVRVRSYILI